MVLSISWHWISSLRLLNNFFSILRLKHLYFLITKVIYTGNFSNVGIYNSKSKNSCNSYPPHLSPCFLLSNGYVLTHTVPHVFMCLADTHTQNRITREVWLTSKINPGKKRTLGIQILFRAVEVSKSQDIPLHRVQQTCLCVCCVCVLQWWGWEFVAALTSSRWNSNCSNQTHLVIDCAPKRANMVTNVGAHTEWGVGPYHVRVTVIDLYIIGHLGEWGWRHDINKYMWQVGPYPGKVSYMVFTLS